MMGNGRWSNCNNCSGIQFFQVAGQYKDGSIRLLCAGCQNNGGVLHQCPHDYRTAQPKWLPLLEAGIGIVCPKCRAVYDLGLKIEPTYPNEGKALEAIGLIVGTIVLATFAAEIWNRIRRQL